MVMAGDGGSGKEWQQHGINKILGEVSLSIL